MLINKESDKLQRSYGLGRIEVEHEGNREIGSFLYGNFAEIEKFILKLIIYKSK